MLVNGIMFFQENMLFDIRYRELKDVVDVFVVVEASETFSGKKKEVNFIYGHLPKVRHFVIDFPSHLNDAWRREYYQRNKIKDLAELVGAKYLVFSDADEIPSREGIVQWAKDGYPHNTAFLGETYYYCFNLCVMDHTIPCSVGVRFPFDEDLQTIRKSKHVVEYPNSGWHFSFIGDAEANKRKILSYSHTELQHFAKKDWIEEAMQSRRDVFGRPNTLKVVDHNLPQGCYDYQDYFVR
jgi:beta-1,4-mannosyl-glycoprotein beta-1,4-N-acetylglucosaminyltransferase